MFLGTPVSESLRLWHDFFLLVGGASATLMGLVFVSTALVTGLRELPPGRDLFASPVVWEFMYAIVLSATCLAPWQDGRALGGCVTFIGLAALIQSLLLIREMRRFQATTRSVTFILWSQTIVAPALAGTLCTASGVLLFLGDLRALGGIAGAAGALHLIALGGA